jgi:hypothetical protein
MLLALGFCMPCLTNEKKQKNWFRVCAACYFVCDACMRNETNGQEFALHGFCSMQSMHANPLLVKENNV